MFYKLCFRLLANNEQMFIIFIYFDEISRIHFRLNYVILKKNKITWGKTILFSYLKKIISNLFQPFSWIFTLRRIMHPPLAILQRCRLHLRWHQPTHLSSQGVTEDNVCKLFSTGSCQEKDLSGW